MLQCNPSFNTSSLGKWQAYIQGDAVVHLPAQALSSTNWSDLHVQGLPLVVRGRVEVSGTCHCKCEIPTAWTIFV